MYGKIDHLGPKAKFEIFSRCKSHLDGADLVIALIDGSQVDDGTAWEIGYCYAKKSPGQKIMVHPANEYLMSGFSCPEGGLPKTKGLIKSAPGQSRASWDATPGMDAHKPIF
ncbi:MAG: nucleoside 2-deoxyribosyltransferase [Syntrophobacteraceae bacterium]